MASWHNLNRISMYDPQRREMTDVLAIFQESGGNPRSTQAHAAMKEAAASLQDVTQDLLNSMEERASAGGAVTAMIDNISKAIAKVCLTRTRLVFSQSFGPSICRSVCLSVYQSVN